MIDRSNREAAKAAALAKKPSLGLLDRPSDIVLQLDRIEAKLTALYNLFSLPEPLTSDQQIPTAEDPDF